MPKVFDVHYFGESATPAVRFQVQEILFLRIWLLGRGQVSFPPRRLDVAEDEKGPSPFEPGPSFHVAANYFLTFALLARAADP